MQMTSQFNKEQIKLEYPEVFDSYSLQLSVQPGLCDERLVRNSCFISSSINY